MSKRSELIYWITERYAMKLRRDTEQHPRWKHGWSDDPTMGLTRWCNVHREDDKVTKWLAKNWRPDHHAVWEIVLARMINYIPSLEQIHMGWQLHPEVDSIFRAAEELRIERDMGKKIFTSAYTISTCGWSMDKIDYVMGVVRRIKELEQQPVDVPFWDKGLHGCWTWMQKVDGLGSFLAAQVVADLKNTKEHPLATAPDWHTFSAPGPGSLRGLSAYFGEDVTPRTYQAKIKQAYEDVIADVYAAGVPLIHMQDFQNCMCEFSKFHKISTGAGHARNRYSAR